MSNTFCRCCDITVKGIYINCPNCGMNLMHPYEPATEPEAYELADSPPDQPAREVDEILNELLSCMPGSHIIAGTLYATQHTIPTLLALMYRETLALIGDDEPIEYLANGRIKYQSEEPDIRNKFREQLRRAAAQRFNQLDPEIVTSMSSSPQPEGGDR